MRAMVVYDSVYGNTERVAHAVGEAVARGLGPSEEIETHRVTDVDPRRLGDLDILIVGAPTHAFRPSRATREFLKRIPAGGLAGVRVAAFDTRISADDMDVPIFPFLVKLFGYAAKPIADGLKRKGGDLALPPEGFYVEDAEGPLGEGELERAAAWASGMALTG